MFWLHLPAEEVFRVQVELVLTREIEKSVLVMIWNNPIRTSQLTRAHPAVHHARVQIDDACNRQAIMPDRHRTALKAPSVAINDPSPQFAHNAVGWIEVFAPVHDRKNWRAIESLSTGFTEIGNFLRNRMQLAFISLPLTGHGDDLAEHRAPVVKECTMNDKLIDWIRKGLLKPGKSGKGLARHLGVNNSVVSRMIHGKRSIKPEELPLIAEYLEDPIPPFQGASDLPKIGHTTDTNGMESKVVRLSPQVRLVEVKAKLALGVWREERVGGRPLVSIASVPALVDPRLKGIEQYACELEESPGRFCIFVPYANYRVSPLHGDVVHVRRTRGVLHEDSLRRVVVSRDGVQLVAVDDPNDVVKQPSSDPDEVVTIRGLLVGRYEMLNF